MKIGKCVLVVAIAAVCWLAAQGAGAAEEGKRGKIVVQASDGIADIIGRYPGKHVILKLASGAEIVGKVALVTAKLVYLTEIRGKEYYDAVIQLERIEAVEVRVFEN